MQTIFRKIKAVMLLFSVLSGFLFGHAPVGANLYYTAEEIETYTAAAGAQNNKGMVIMIGGGFDTEALIRPLIEKSFRHVGKTDPHMLFIPTGGMDEMDEDYEAVIQWFANAGCSTDLLLVTQSTAEEAAAKIEAADIIYETGGNLKFLNEQWDLKGVKDAVRAAYARGAVLMGPSTGAMCWAARGWDNFGEPVRRIVDEFPFIGVEGAYEFCESTGLVPFCIVPHFDNIAWRVYGFTGISQDFPTICIENGAAVACCNGVYEVLSDARTPLRTAYLFYPEKSIAMMNLKNHTEILTVIDGEQRVKGA